MDFTGLTDSELSSQLTNMAKSKFTPPYLDNDNRKAIDEIIFATWQEINSRKESDDETD